MKKYKLLCFAFLLCTIILPAQHINAQNQEYQKDHVIHNQKYFLKAEQFRFAEILKHGSSQLEKEHILVKKLGVKNDSLLNAGNIYDSISVSVKNQLTDYLRRIDSLNQEISKLKLKLTPFKSFRKQHRMLQPQIATFENGLNSNSPVYALIYKRVNDLLDSSNLTGEKGRLKGMLTSANAQQQKEAAQIVEIGNRKEDLLLNGNVDVSVSVKIDSRLQTYQRRMDSISKEINLLQQKLNSPGEFAKEFKFIKTKVLLIDSIVNKNALAREYVFQMIDEGLLNSKKNLFSLAAFFGPGGYIIPENKYSMATKYFSPVIDSLVKFSNSYSSLYRTASVIVNGYADATTIGNGSKLYNVLCTYLNKSNPAKEELNSALSALRAEEISKLLSKILKERFPDFKAINKIIFETVENGMGEKLPEPTISNYTNNDERRRVVIIFWSVLPIE
jgi:hypothetical protein